MQTKGLLDGRYQLLHEIGTGSEGKVFLAMQESTYHFFAVKEVKKDQLCFSREAIQVWKRIHHPRLPAIHDVLETEDRIWIIMEYIDGTNMSEWVRQNGRPGFWMLFRWTYAICDTLSYLHKQNPPIIFGDLKPDNIMIRDNMPVMVDLGSAYMEGSKTRKTGTNYYCSSTCGKEDGIKEDMNCLGTIIKWLLSKKTREFEAFTRQKFSHSQDGIRFLKKLFVQRVLRIAMLAGAGGLLLFAGQGLSNEWKDKKVEEAYEELLLETRQKTEDSNSFGWEDMILTYPEKEEGYLEWIDDMLEDQNLDKEEYRAFLDVWQQVSQNGQTNEEILRDNLSGYARVVYKIGLACWYFYQDRERTSLAMKWFWKLQSFPEELQWKSKSYLLLGEVRDKEGIYQKTRETKDFFIRYERELEDLDFSEEEEYFQMMFWKERLLFLNHYMVELMEEGMTEAEISAICKECEEWLDMNRDVRGKETMSELIQEVERLVHLVDETKKRIFDEGIRKDRT